MKEPDLEDNKLAEFIGILLGDGCIGKYKCSSSGKTSVQRYVKVTLSSREIEYSNYVKDLYRELFGIQPKVSFKKNENVVEIRSFRKDLFYYLTKKVGMVKAPKWERAKIPERYNTKEFRVHVLRGYFDTDGSLVLADNNSVLYPRLEMKICPSPMQDQFQSILESKGFNFGSYDIGKNKIRIQMNGKTQLRKWIEEVGFNNYKHRKKLENLIAGGGFEPPTSGCLKNR